MKIKKIMIGSEEFEYYSVVLEDSIKIIFKDEIFEFKKDDLCHIPQWRLGDKSQVWSDNDFFTIERVSASRKKNSQSAGSLISPMPGKIFKLLVVKGDKVKAGQTLLILEAMKMEHSIKAPTDGIVSDLFYNVGDIVDGGVALVTLSQG